MSNSKPRKSNYFYLSVGLWGLVNNAGVMGQMVPSEWLKYQDYLKVFNINVFGKEMKLRQLKKEY